MSEDAPNTESPTSGVERPSTTKYGPSSAAGPTPNPRSCVTCRRRKVKCDKNNPCSHCVRAKIDCVYPGPGRAPRKSRKPPDAELLERLRRLEGVVSSLNAQVEEHEQEAVDRDKERRSSTSDQGCSRHSPSVAADNSVDGLETRFGRLVVEKGRSRYINSSFWASLNNEVRGPQSAAYSLPPFLTPPRSKISKPSSWNLPTMKTMHNRLNPPMPPPTRDSSLDTALRTSICNRCILRNSKRGSSGKSTR